MPRIPGLQDLKKRWKKRARIWLLGFICLLLIDEYVKEGYLFDIRDILYPGTHEFLIIIFTIVFVLITFPNFRGPALP